jgi:hypothetical protein
VLASEYDAPDAQQTSVTPVAGQASVRDSGDDSSDRRKDAEEKAKREAADARRKALLSVFGEQYLKDRTAKPFSDLLGKLEPGTITATGYLIGDNGEFLNPNTGEQDFFGADGFLIPLGFRDRPKLDLSIEGGVNRRFIDSFKYDTNVGREQGRLKRIKDQQEKGFENFTKSERGKELIASAVESKQKEKQKKEDVKKRQQELNKKTEDKFKQTIAKEKKEKKDKPKSKPTSYSSGRAKQTAQNFKDYFGLKEGGLASKPKPKPKKMRSGGLASKK